MQFKIKIIAKFQLRPKGKNAKMCHYLKFKLFTSKNLNLFVLI